MGLNDAREQLEVAKAQSVIDERTIAELTKQLRREQQQVADLAALLRRADERVRELEQLLGVRQQRAIAEQPIDVQP